MQLRSNFTVLSEFDNGRDDEIRRVLLNDSLQKPNCTYSHRWCEHENSTHHWICMAHISIRIQLIIKIKDKELLSCILSSKFGHI